MKKVVYQNLAVVDVVPHVLAEFEGQHKTVRVKFSLGIETLTHSGALQKAIERDIKEAFGISEEVEFFDITRDLPLPTGPHTGPTGFGAWEDDYE
jgi:hypothetical protein